MANFGGFQIETPQEVLARLNSQIDTDLQSRDFNTQTRARTSRLLTTLFGSPEAKRAQERVDVADKAFTDLDRLPGESDIDWRIRQNNAFFEGMKDVDPTLAAQAAERATALQNEKLERDQLMSAEERRASNEDRLAAQEEDRQAKVRRQNLFDNIGYARDRKTGELRAFDLGDTADAARFGLAGKDPNMQILTREELNDLEEAELDDADSKLYNRSVLSKKIDTYTASIDAVQRQRRIMEILTAEPDTLTVAAKLEKGINNLVTEIGAASRATAIDLGGYEKDLASIRSRIAPEARARGVTDAMVLNLAYSLARALDPGGRLSDKDLELALDMIGGRNADPSVFARIALESAEQNTRRLTGEFDRVRDSLNESERTVLGRSNVALIDERNALREQARRWVPENEFNAITSGLPIIPQEVRPQAPLDTSAEEAAALDGPITIEILD